MGFVMTTLLGIAGSVIGGLIASAVSSGGDATGFHGSGFIGSILGALALLFLAGMVTGPRRRVA
jgi:uncharacterized membrane protein YeaQ/YmgE (transglycosylase-associated protein family)